MKSRAGFTLIELMIVMAIIAIIAAIAIPNLIEARKNANQTAAMGAIKTIYNAQSMYREGDKDGNGDFDYGSLTQLAATGFLLDDVLASGTKQGYLFDSNAATNSPSFKFYIVANPAALGTTGDRAFCTDTGGALHYTTETITIGGSLTTDGDLPSNVIPVK